MKLTAQEEYGLRCILRLARAPARPAPPASVPEEGTSSFTVSSASSSSSGPSAVPSFTVGEVARLEGLSVQYAGKLIRLLGKAGLVESVRGCKGGYRLARPAQLISVAEALAALGGKMYEPKICERFTGDRNFCVHTSDCAIRSLWSGLQIMIDGVLSRTTLHDLVSAEKSMAQWITINAEALQKSFKETNVPAL
jgi:Rrf2 family protein